MAFEDRAIRRQRVRYDSDNDDNKLVYPFTIRGEKATPSSATIEIHKPGRSSAALAETAMNVDGTLLNYTLDTSSDTDLWEVMNGYRADVVVTSGGVTYDRYFVFDIVKFILVLGTNIDTLRSIDSNLKGMEHLGDEDFSPLINFFKDDIQSKIEAKALKEKKLLQDMILDYHGLEIAHAYRCLAQIWMDKGDMEKHESYLEMYKDQLGTILSTIKYDDDQDGEESEELGGVQEVRLVQ